MSAENKQRTITKQRSSPERGDGAPDVPVWLAEDVEFLSPENLGEIGWQGRYFLGPVVKKARAAVSGGKVTWEQITAFLFTELGGLRGAVFGDTDGIEADLQAMKGGNGDSIRRIFGRKRLALLSLTDGCWGPEGIGVFLDRRTSRIVPSLTVRIRQECQARGNQVVITDLSQLVASLTASY